MDHLHKHKLSRLAFNNVRAFNTSSTVARGKQTKQFILQIND